MKIDDFDDICELFELPKKTCDHCRRQDNRHTGHAHTAIAAEYDGWCGECGRKIYKGNMIVATTSSGHWAHKECV